jgi:hypothetical protein
MGMSILPDLELVTNITGPCLLCPPYRTRHHVRPAVSSDSIQASIIKLSRVKMRLLIAALWLCAVYANQVPFANSKAEILDAQADDFINHILKEWNSPGGIGVAVVRRDGDK